MKRPWMPLYVDDYQRDTNRLSTLEHGAYLLLLMEYWRHGELPDDERALARIARLSDREWKKVRVELVRLFLPRWKHKRVEQELAEAEEISQRRKAAADERWNRERANAGANAGASDDANAQTEHDANASTRALSRDTLHNSPSNPTPPDARDRFAELEHELRKAAGAENNPSPKLMIVAPILGLIDQGADLESEILPAIRAKPRSDVRSWDYFVPQIQEFRASRQRAADAPMPKAAGPPSGKRNLAIAHFEERLSEYDESADEPYIPNASRA